MKQELTIWFLSVMSAIGICGVLVLLAVFIVRMLRE